MSYKDYYESIEEGNLEEDAEFSHDSFSRTAWKIRTKRTIDMITKQLDILKKDAIVVDVGCAGGWLNSGLISKGCKHRYVGCDISLSYLSLWKDSANSCRVLCDANAMPFKQYGPDIVTSFETVEHLPNPQGAAAEFKKIAASVIAISVPLEGIDISFLGSRKFDRYAGLKDLKIREFIAKVGWDKGLRVIQQKSGSAHVNFFTANRLKELFRHKNFQMTRVRGAFFYIPQLLRILSNKATRKLYLFFEKVFLSWMPVFVSHVRFLPFKNIGNRYGILILYRIGTAD